MRCINTSECFEQMSAYFDGKKTGYFLLVNTENYDVYQEILQRLEADSCKRCVYISQNCLPNGLPDVDAAVSIASGSGNYALVGLSQAQMLRSDSALAAKLDEVLSYPISGYGIVLLDHCEQTLQKFMNRDIRLKKRVLLVDGEVSPLPQIKFAKTEEECIGFRPLSDIPRLLSYLERLTDMQRQNHPAVTALCSFPVDMFRNAVYSVTASEGIYEALTTKYSDIAGATEKAYGTDVQWSWLASKMSGKSSFSALVCDEFGATANLSAHLSDVWGSADKKMQWLLWLSLKSFGEANNHYLTLILGNCDHVDSFEMHAYLDFADVDISHPEFERYYTERKRLLEQLPENLSLIKKYCDKLGRHQKDEVFYLTDSSAQEKYEFVRHKFLGNSVIKRLEKIQFRSDEEIRKRLLPDTSIGSGEWVDISGLIAPKSEIERLMSDIETGALSTVDQIHDRFADMHAHYYTYEWTWAYEKMLEFYQLDAERITASDICTIVRQWQDSVVGLDRLVYEDAKKEFSLTSMTGFGADGSKAEQKLDFEQVRGVFESNPFVTAVLEHIKVKTELGNELLDRLSGLV